MLSDIKPILLQIRVKVIKAIRNNLSGHPKILYHFYDLVGDHLINNNCYKNIPCNVFCVVYVKSDLYSDFYVIVLMVHRFSGGRK